MKPLDPIVREILVAVAPASAFEAFTASIARWWPTATHSLSSERCMAPPIDVIMDAHEGGRIYEIMANGEIALWGSITKWVPNECVAFTWHVGRKSDQHTDVEVTFAASEAGTKVTLVHSNWERLGEDAEGARAGYSSGWVGVLDGAFGDYVASLAALSQA